MRVVYIMVLLRNSILWKHAQLYSMTVCRESGVVHYKKNYEKSPPLKSPRLHIQMMWTVSHNPGKNVNLQRTISITFLCWCHASSWHVIPPWATEKSQEAGTALHMLGTLHSSYNAQDVYIYICIFFPESLVSSVLMRFITRELTSRFFHQHGDLKWLKTKSSHHEVMHKSRN